jgi:hypothetical protein
MWRQSQELTLEAGAAAAAADRATIQAPDPSAFVAFLALLSTIPLYIIHTAK